MPPLKGAQRNLAPAPPAQRNAWYCPNGCRPLNEPMGWAQNAKAAEIAGLRHFYTHHDHPTGDPKP